MPTHPPKDVPWFLQMQEGLLSFGTHFAKGWLIFIYIYIYTYIDIEKEMYIYIYTYIEREIDR